MKLKQSSNEVTEHLSFHRFPAPKVVFARNLCPPDLRDSDYLDALGTDCGHRTRDAEMHVLFCASILSGFFGSLLSIRLVEISLFSCFDFLPQLFFFFFFECSSLHLRTVVNWIEFCQFRFLTWRAYSLWSINLLGALFRPGDGNRQLGRENLNTKGARTSSPTVFGTNGHRLLKIYLPAKHDVSA